MIFIGRRFFSFFCSLLCCLLLGLSTLSGGVLADSIIARVGEDVNLICNYDAQYYGKLSACWGRGDIPNSGCANEVIKSDGTWVTSRLSERYLLMGDIGRGDVSLTIRQVEEGDSGKYGCRVEIPGWFNDHKHQLTLTVVAVRPDALRVETREVKERTITVHWTPGFDGGRPITTYRIDLKNKHASWDTALRTEVSNVELTQLTLVDLRPAKSYNIRMFAINNVGMSEASNILTFTMKEAAPQGPPLDMQVVALTSRSIKVSWKPPRPELINGLLRSYSISYREYDPTGRQFRGWHHVSMAATSGPQNVILSNLKPSTPYGVIVQAKTNAGIGPASTAPLCSTLDEVLTTSTVSTLTSTYTPVTMWIQDNTSFSSSTSTSTVEAVTAATVWDDWGFTTLHSTASFTSVAPDPPVVQVKEVKDNTISLLWTPGFEGDSAITGYYLEYKAVNASWDDTKTVVDFSPNQTDATIIEINPSTYNIRMFAKNSQGTSKASTVLTITTGESGHHIDDPVTTLSTDTPDAPAQIKESHSGHLAAIVLPVVLVLLVVAMVTVWQLRRMRNKNGNLSMWMATGGLRYRGAESLQEL